MTSLEPDASLLAKTATGGDIGESGISFQAWVGMASIPDWLMREGFTAMIREGLSDIEMEFFDPSRGLVKEAISAKKYALTPGQFWGEIDIFQSRDKASPGTYQWFTVASTGLSESVEPLSHGLRRLRDPYGFYQHDGAIVGASYTEYRQRVTALGRNVDDAEFLYKQVRLQSDWSPNDLHNRAVVAHSLSKHFPQLQDHRTVEQVIEKLSIFLQSRRAQPIYRTELEDVLSSVLTEDQALSRRPVRLYTAFDGTVPDLTQIIYHWEDFFGGQARNYPPSVEWNTRLLGELHATKAWIEKYRGTRRIRLDGQRRLSASLAIGFAFSAVSGFAIDMVHRGEIWSTDTHAGPDTPDYPFKIQESPADLRGNRLTVAIGIPRDIATFVVQNRGEHGLDSMPWMHITGEQPLQNAQQVNRVVMVIKDHIGKALTRTGAHQIDLFIAGPAQLALFLGHRLNATAAIQCYEQGNTGRYVPTCQLS